MPGDFEIYVGNIYEAVKEDDLRTAFRDYNVQKLRLLSTGTRKYAFLELNSFESVCKAVKNMSNYSVKGRKFVVRAGNPQLHNDILKSTQNQSCNGVYAGQDEGPPPLEAVYAPGPAEDEDLPPPLEPALPQGSLADWEMPPPLECVVPQANVVYSRNIEVKNAPVSLVVANIPFGATEDDLNLLFKKFSPLKTTVIVNSRLRDPTEKTYAYMTVPDQTLAEQAIFEMDNTLFMQKRLIVTYVLERVQC